MDCFQPRDFLDDSPSSSPPPYPVSSPDHFLSCTDSLEHDFCTNFSCCGIPLPDLHALLDHFEEHHVVVFNTDGLPIYPGLRASSVPSVSSSRSRSPSLPPTIGSSMVLNYPHPEPPSYGDALEALLDPLDPLYPLAQAASTYRDVVSRHSDYASSAVSSPTAGEEMCLPPSLLTKHADAHDAVAYQPADAHSGAPHRDAPHAGRPRARMLTQMERKARRADRTSPTKRRDREKMYKCPHAGCLKSYLNPNGLKYHLEKGTCVIDPSYAPPPDSSPPPYANVDVFPAALSR